MNSNTPAKKILILAANPKQTSRLRLDEEVRDIKEGLRLSQQRDKFILQQEWAVRPRDVRRAVLDFRPNIIHFSGHGAGSTGLSFEDEIGKEKLVTSVALAGLFGQFAKQVECVVLNACYSEEQALAIAQHIDYVIGMNAAIGDKAALEFAVGFYDALVAYDPQYDTYSRIEFAFNIACNAIQFAGVSGISMPIMKKKPHLGKVEEQRANLVEESRLSNDTVSVRQNLSQEDVASIEAIISNQQFTSTNQNEPNSLDESRLSSNTATLNQKHNQSIPETASPDRLANFISVLRNKKLLISASIAGVALTSYFVFNSQPNLTEVSTPPVSVPLSEGQRTADPAGTWKITQSRNLKGNQYGGIVDIQPTGEIYNVSWNLAKEKYSGLGFFEDGHLYVGWSSTMKPYGVVLYHINQDGTLDGKWTTSRLNGKVLTEKAIGIAGQVQGQYKISGINPDSTSYKGTLSINKKGNIYQVLWNVGQTNYQGIGLLSGNKLVVVWGDPQKIGFIDYTINGNEATGLWGILNQSKEPEVGTENLVRIP